MCAIMWEAQKYPVSPLELYEWFMGHMYIFEDHANKVFEL